MGKRVQKRRAKVNIPICAAGILLCLTMFSVHLVGGVYARYTATASGSDSARVIKFGELEVEDTITAQTITVGDIKQIIVIPGVPIEREVTVSFGGSESSTFVFLEVVVEEGAADWAWTLGSDKKTFSTHYFDHDGDTDTAEVPGLYWSVADGWTYVMQDGNSYVYYKELAPNDESLKTTGAQVIAGKQIFVHDTLSSMDLLGVTDGSDELAVNFRASVVQSNGFTGATRVADAWNSVKTH